MACISGLGFALLKIKHANKVKQEHSLSKLNNIEPLDFTQSRATTGLNDS